MLTVELETVMPLCGKSTSLWSGSAVSEETATDIRMNLMLLHDRFKGPIDALGERLDPSMGRPEDLPEITDN